MFFFNGYFIFSIQLIIPENNEIIIAPRIADQIPFTSNPSNIPAEIHNTTPFIIKENNPSDRMINGNEKNERIGFNIELSRPNTIAANKAVLKFLITIPGNSAAVA